PHYYYSLKEQHATKFYFPPAVIGSLPSNLPPLPRRIPPTLTPSGTAQSTRAGSRPRLPRRQMTRASFPFQAATFPRAEGEDEFTALLLGQGQGRSEFPSPRDFFSFAISFASCLAFARPRPPQNETWPRWPSRTINAHLTYSLPTGYRCYRVTRPGRCQKEHRQETSGVNNNQACGCTTTYNK
ncbi:unnamed protein product, partial [Ectocarpus sp. 8 AP-2014]